MYERDGAMLARLTEPWSGIVQVFGELVRCQARRKANWSREGLWRLWPSQWRCLARSQRTGKAKRETVFEGGVVGKVLNATDGEVRKDVGLP